MGILGIYASQISGHLKVPFFINASNSTSNKAQTSPDGITWTAQTLPSSANWDFPSYGNDLYLIKNGTTTYATSPNGSTWTSRTSNLSSTASAYGNSTFVAITTDSGTNAETSTNGTSWTTRTIGGSARYGNLVYGEKFVTVCYDTQIAQTSSDGITWTDRTMPSKGYWLFTGWGNSIYVAFQDASQSQYATSSDGVTWTGYTYTAPTGDWFPRQIAYGAGIWVVATAGSTNKYITSTLPTGGSWTERTFPFTATNQNLAFGNGVFVLSPRGTTNAATSTNGTTWTTRTQSSSSTWTSLLYA